MFERGVAVASTPVLVSEEESDADPEKTLSRSATDAPPVQADHTEKSRSFGAGDAIF